MKNEVFAQLTSNEINSVRKGKKDLATILSELSKRFDADWKTLEYRIQVIPGKLFLSALNEYLQCKYKISITATQILDKAKKQDIAKEIVELLNNIESFKNFNRLVYA